MRSCFWSLVALFCILSFAAAEQPAWKLVATKATFAPRDSCGELVFNNRMWIMGGSSKIPGDKPRHGGNFGDTWYSKDGKTWNEYKADVVWGQRHEHSSYVFQDKLWVVTGMTPPLNNEVWSLELPKDWAGE